MEAEIQSRDSLFYPTRTHLGKIRSNSLWKFLVQACIPIFEFLWEYVINFRGKIEYLTSGFVSSGRPILQQSRVEILRGDPHFESLAHRLKKRISDSSLAQWKEEISQKPGETGFVMEVANKLNDETRADLLRFAVSDEVMKIVLPYFGMVPRIGCIQVLYNIPRQGLDQKGSKCWHRDGNLYKSLDFFVCVSDVDDESGPYSAIGLDTIPYHEIVPVTVIDRNVSDWQNSRISDAEMIHYAPKATENKLCGPPGTVALVDSGACYHKGGFCNSKDRIMIRIAYQIDDHEPTQPIINQLKLSKYPKLGEILNTRIKRRFVRSNGDNLIVKMGLKNPVYTIGRKILSYYCKPKF